MKATILVRLKDYVPDAQGTAMKERLSRMGYGEIKRLRVGKLIELELDKTDRDTASWKLKKVCEELLCNAVIEDFEILKFD